MSYTASCRPEKKMVKEYETQFHLSVFLILRVHSTLAKAPWLYCQGEGIDLNHAFHPTAKAQTPPLIFACINTHPDAPRPLSDPTCRHTELHEPSLCRKYSEGIRVRFGLLHRGISIVRRRVPYPNWRDYPGVEIPSAGLCRRGSRDPGRLNDQGTCFCN